MVLSSWRAPTATSLPDGSAAKDMITPAAQQAIDQGLAYLSHCQREDGSFGVVQYHGNVAITSLAALAMISGGHQPGRGIYGTVVTRALRYVLEQSNGGYLISKTGYFARADVRAWFWHAFPGRGAGHGA